MQNDTTAQRSRQQVSIDRAIAKAFEQARAGNLPALLRRFTDDPHQTTEVWSIGSRTTGGTIYIIDLIASADGVETHCECAGAGACRICWHRAAVRLSALGEIDGFDGLSQMAADDDDGLATEPAPACRIAAANLVTANGRLVVPGLVGRLTAAQLGIAPSHPYAAYTLDAAGALAMAAD